MKRIITLITALALIAPSAAQAQYKPSYSAPSYSRPSTTYSSPSSSRPSYTAPTTKIGGTGSGSTYRPPSTLPKVPSNPPRSIPPSAYSDPHSSQYWANPSSPYYWYFLSTHGESEDEVSWTIILWVLLGCGVVFGLMAWGMSWMERRPL
jgi:hypothetical protein